MVDLCLNFNMNKEEFYIGVDVGSYSVRAALVKIDGSVIDVYSSSIIVQNIKPDFFEQSSRNIWNAVCHCVKKVSESVVDKTLIKGIGFDATCSLVVVGKDKPISVSSHGDILFDIIMWMDHRAKNETDYINSKHHRMLQYIGGKISLEMQLPKLLWLKKNMKSSWEEIEYLFDLPDFLTYKATGSLTRSLCSCVCKWTYESTNKQQGWISDLFHDIGLEDLLENNFSKIGSDLMMPGTKCGELTANAASEMNLVEGTCVGTSMIDAYAGFLALLGAEADEETHFLGRLGLICGTSTCHMIACEKPLFVPGIWGPYYDVLIHDLWVNEGGQSATGSLIDYVIQMHPATGKCSESDIYGWLEEVLDSMAKTVGVSDINLLTSDIHVYPDFHGNRSPLADSLMRGMYSTKDIVEKLKECGHAISSVLMCGGLCNSTLFVKVHADVLGIPILLPMTKHPVALGSAMLGAAASGSFKDLKSAVLAMGGRAQTYVPQTCNSGFHNKKYAVFKKMQEDQKVYRILMC